jgi:hypothetical protein
MENDPVVGLLAPPVSHLFGISSSNSRANALSGGFGLPAICLSN